MCVAARRFRLVEEISSGQQREHRDFYRCGGCLFRFVTTARGVQDPKFTPGRDLSSAVFRSRPRIPGTGLEASKRSKAAAASSSHRESRLCGVARRSEQTRRTPRRRRRSERHIVSREGERKTCREPRRRERERRIVRDKVGPPHRPPSTNGWCAWKAAAARSSRRTSSSPPRIAHRPRADPPSRYQSYTACFVETLCVGGRNGGGPTETPRDL